MALLSHWVHIYSIKIFLCEKGRKSCSLIPLENFSISMYLWWCYLKSSYSSQHTVLAQHRPNKYPIYNVKSAEYWYTSPEPHKTYGVYGAECHQ